MTRPSPDDSAPPPAGRRGLARRLIPLYVLALLFGAGLAIGKFAFPAKLTQVEKPESGPAHLEAPEGNLGPLEMRKKGDRLLAAGSPTQALEIYRKTQPDGRRVRASHLHYRAGLCQEILGRHELALAAYRAAAGSDGAEGLRSAILLGQARLHFRERRFAEARILLQPIVLDERENECPSHFRTEARILAALAAAEEQFPTPESSREDGDYGPDRLLSAYRFADDLPPFNAPKSPPKPAEDRIEIHVQPEQEPRAKTMRWTKGSAVEAFDLLGKSAGLELQWSGKAKAAASERSLVVAVENWPVLDVAQAMADAIELVATIERKSLRLRLPSELAEAELIGIRDAMAERMLQGAMRSEADHSGVGLLMLRLADASMRRKKKDEAETWLKRLTGEQPNSSWCIPAHFALASLRFEEGNLTAARRHLFRAIDLGPGNLASARAHTFIGRAFLEEGDPAAALRHLRRAQGLAPETPVFAQATLLAASAHLVMDQPDASRDLIAAKRTHLKKDAFELPYAFLKAYAQYRAAKAQKLGRRESRDLYEAAKAQGDDPILGRWGRLLQAQAYLEMNLPQEALSIAETTLGTARGPVTEPLRLAHGEALHQLGRRDEAEKQFAMLESSATSERWKRNAVWQLAQADLDRDRVDECLRRCRLLWDGGADNREALLAVWGEAWRRKGDFAKASRCFAGSPPE